MMNLKIPHGTKPAIWGAVIGAVALAIVGFTWGGWTTAGTANQNAKSSAEAAVVAVLAPMCAEKFRQQTNFRESLAELMKAGAWQQGSFIEKGGWATMPGKTSPDSGVATACANLLSKQ